MRPMILSTSAMSEGAFVQNAQVAPLAGRLQSPTSVYSGRE